MSDLDTTINIPDGISKAEFVYRSLRSCILTGELPSKTRLILDKIARQYSVSSVPVREAIRRLEAEGLVQFERNVGAVVASFNETDMLNSFETLAVIEAYVTGVSAGELNEEEIAQAEELNQQMRQAVKRDFSPQVFSQLNAQFHQLLASRCANPRLRLHLDLEWNHHAMHRFANQGYTLEWCVRSVTEHEEILKLIRARESSQKIEAYCRAHNLRVVKQLQAQEQPQTEENPISADEIPV